MNAIEIKGLRKQYGGFTLGGLDFTLPEGCITGLVGENGAGKSTLLRLIVGMTRPDAGELRVLGAPVGGEAFRALREDIGYVPDETYFPEMLTPRDVGAVLSRAYSRWDAASYAALLERFALPVRKPVRELSRGMKMKLSLAAALAHRPRLLVLDEATGGLDPVARDGILDLLNDFTRDETHTVLLSSHILSDLEKICDYVAFLRFGRMCKIGLAFRRNLCYYIVCVDFLQTEDDGLAEKRQTTSYRQMPARRRGLLVRRRGVGGAAARQRVFRRPVRL